MRGTLGVRSAVGALVVAAVSCGGRAPEPSDGVAPAPTLSSPRPAGPWGTGAGPYFPLGLNDVTILVPLPPSVAEPVVARASDRGEDQELITPDAFDGLMMWLPAGFARPAYGRLHVVAVRFDLCDRDGPGPCPPDADGRMRLVFQPILDGNDGADDVGVHVFYSIPSSDVPEAVGALRSLARRRHTATDAPLQPSPALAAFDASYAAALRDLVRRYARSRAVVRMTINARDANHLASTGETRWFFTGIEGSSSEAPPTLVASSHTAGQFVTFEGRASYTATPPADAPFGLSDVLLQSAFDANDDGGKRKLLNAIVQADNPLVSATKNVSCVACHAATVVTAVRAATSSIDPASLPGYYASSRDLSVAYGRLDATPNTLRAFGWLGVQPMISQRVVNETAQVLDEIEQRFP